MSATCHFSLPLGIAWGVPSSPVGVLHRLSAFVPRAAAFDDIAALDDSGVIRHIYIPHAYGQAAVEPAMPLMKSRRRIASPKGTGLMRTMLSSEADYSRVLRRAEWGVSGQFARKNSDADVA